MHGTTPGLRSDPDPRLAELDRQRPEYRTWLRLLGETRSALDDPVWSRPFAQPGDDGVGAVRAPGEPLLNGRELSVDPEALCGLVGRLLEAAPAAVDPRGATSWGRRLSADTSMHLLLAALQHDFDGIAALAALAGVEPGTLKTVAVLAALPVLRSSGRLLEEQVPQSWTSGYCPICGSWPLLAELRSLDRTRRLRCGGCAGDWQFGMLCCPYCGEKDHERLGTLVLDEKLATFSVETCSSCHGYIKTITTLQAIPPFDLLLRDLETLELDLAAVDRGYARPGGAGFTPDLHLTARTPRSTRQLAGDD